MNFLYGKKPLTEDVGSFYIAANLHPCWTLAQSQLPYLRPSPLFLVALPFPLPTSRQHDIYLHTDDTPGSSTVGPVAFLVPYLLFLVMNSFLRLRS